MFYENLRELGHVKPRNLLEGLGKLLQGKADGLVINQKKDWFETATAKRANANLGIKISRHIISQRLNEINLNSRVGSTKPYISEKNKMSWLKFATEHVTWTEEQWDFVHFSNESKFSLFSYDRRFVQCSPKEQYLPQSTKSSVKFGGGSVMVFGMISVVVWDLLSGCMVKLTQLYTKW